MTPTTIPTLNTEWDFENGSELKDYLFPSESNNSECIFGKLPIPNRHHHYNHHQSHKIDRSMVNSSQESDFYGFTPTPAGSIETANVILEKIPENEDIINDNDDDDDDHDVDIGTFEEHIIRYQTEVVLANNDNNTETATTNPATMLLEQHQLRGKLCNTNSTEYGLEQTIASEEFSDQDIRCQNEMTKNEQQLKDQIKNGSVDECNESHLTIEPTSDEDDNDASLYHVGSPPVLIQKHHQTKIATSTMTTTNFHTHCTLEEDSDNAVDNAISNERCTIGGSSTPKDLSFNGKLKHMQPATNTNESTSMPNNNNNNSSSQFNLSEEKDLTTISINDKSNLELQLQLERSREHINERSPDLFSEVDDYDTTVNDAMHDNDIVSAAAADDDDVGVDGPGINDSADIKTDDGTSTTVLTDKHIEKTERALNKRIQTLLSGIIPPPSVTFVQHDITNLLSIYKQNITQMDAPSNVCDDKKRTEETCDEADKIPIMPNALENIEWPQIKRTNAFGVHYNRTKYTDNIEIMYMKLVERFAGEETASSFTFNGTANASAAAAKKKPMRKPYVNK